MPTSKVPEVTELIRSQVLLAGIKSLDTSNVPQNNISHVHSSASSATNKVLLRMYKDKVIQSYLYNTKVERINWDDIYPKAASRMVCRCIDATLPKAITAKLRYKKPHLKISLEVSVKLYNKPDYVHVIITGNTPEGECFP